MLIPTQARAFLCESLHGLIRQDEGEHMPERCWRPEQAEQTPCQGIRPSRYGMLLQGGRKRGVAASDDMASLASSQAI